VSGDYLADVRVTTTRTQKNRFITPPTFGRREPAQTLGTIGKGVSQPPMPDAAHIDGRQIIR